MVRIEPADIRKKGKVPKNGSLFFTIFQTFMASTGSATALSLSMNNYHKNAILKMSPKAKQRAHLIREYTGNTGSVSDPYGQDRATYDSCAEELRQAMPPIVEWLRPHHLPALRCPECGNVVESS
jgi:hypothetical protein